MAAWRPRPSIIVAVALAALALVLALIGLGVGVSPVAAHTEFVWFLVAGLLAVAAAALAVGGRRVFPRSESTGERERAWIAAERASLDEDPSAEPSEEQGEAAVRPKEERRRELDERESRLRRKAPHLRARRSRWGEMLTLSAMLAGLLATGAAVVVCGVQPKPAAARA